MIRRLIRWLKRKLFGTSAGRCTIGDTTYKIKSWRVDGSEDLGDYVESVTDLDVEYTLSVPQPRLAIQMNEQQIADILSQGRVRFTDEQWNLIKEYVEGSSV